MLFLGYFDTRRSVAEICVIVIPRIHFTNVFAAHFFLIIVRVNVT